MNDVFVEERKAVIDFATCHASTKSINFVLESNSFALTTITIIYS